ncbi:MAG: hypothetical protein MAG453_02049 [Calditrichaeota bacterium]|nr:hypothetical protein [Calditrichota bacterium]
MNSRSLLLCSLSTLVLSSFSQVCSAQPRLAAFASLSTNDYSMGDVNEELRALGIERISSGSGWSVGVRGHMASISLSMSYSRLSAETHHSYDAGIIEYQLPANVIEGAIDVGVEPTDIIRFASGLGVGYYWTAGEIRISGDADGADRTVSAKISGNTIGLRPYVRTEVKLSRRISLFANVGLKFAKISEVRSGEVSLDDEEIPNYDDTEIRNYSVDYSGLQGSGGISILPFQSWDHSISSDSGGDVAFAVGYLSIMGAYVIYLFSQNGG